MFAHPLDPPSVTAARALEERHIAAWVQEARARGAARRRNRTTALGGGAWPQHEALVAVS